MSNNYLLVRLNSSWADEFDVEALWVTTSEEFKTWLEELDTCVVNNVEIYFGTNESITFDSKEEIINSLIVTEITSTFYNQFIALIGETFGLINLKTLPEIYKESEDEDY